MSNIRGRLDRLERELGDRPPVNVFLAVANLRDLFTELADMGLEDPFPELQGQAYLDAVAEWVRLPPDEGPFEELDREIEIEFLRLCGRI